MAKKVYQIPRGLDQTFLDIEIGMRSDSGVGFHPIPLRTIFAFIVSGATCYFLVSSVFRGNGSVLLTVLFVVLWIALTFLLFKPDRSGDMSVYRVPALVRYLSPGARRVTCRSTSDAAGFYQVSQFDHVDEERGIVYFVDGSVAYAYRVTGSASVLLFEEDRDAIIDRVDAFYRNMKTDYELIYLTTRKAQDVVRQVNTMTKRVNRLVAPDDAELQALAKTERMVLSDYVGGQYRSIHQFLVVRAPSIEALDAGKNMLEAEVQNSTLMFKRVVSLYDDDLLDVFATVFKGKESV